jgi:hypothetical protein
MKRNIHYIIPVIALFMTASCAKQVSQEELIKAAVQLKLDQWRVSQLKECRQETYLRAETYVDSLLVAISLGAKLDTIPKPAKPVKPSRPTFKSKPDSVIIDQIYDQE